ncbi:MAG: DegT/DnrJ/EryC1/StrS family aminotransferase [Gemmatimonadetes bacterium]|nr:DegT/DnrJ/EryC1/StrS family aminotransferase [Gemmatimonadota bacterium]MBT5060325.1 DegT/DnrJ/EryC1/StrS family aminotransferase [Gemmatimonadota bacterium]MBT5146396.1 DegT/DnrJ/EryC1/StrS family aminotransferase [Gemmatimonadota bacterium]MBT5591319.1 DegT/DnrJ/EryC1/StrS family aminotransferase [Gemmatimonadota bacterium]MBT5962226.1 DegT/DnrJ/EryC1/StrS family aminotransferase [Gemmatimonadota bacterium]
MTMPDVLPIASGGPFLPEEDVEPLLEDFAQILRSGQLTQGEFLERFETDFAAVVGVTHAVGMNSGTAPLEVGLRFAALDGGEVIVPTNTFAASVSAVCLAGGTPVLADIDALTLGSGRSQIEELIGPRTRAVMAVHVGGFIDPAFDELVALCREAGLMLLEDAAHAHGARIESGGAGSLGDAAGFSFYATKVLTCGEGGMLTTNNAELAAFARSWRSHGQAADSRDIVRVGHNYRLPEMSAALGWRQLQRLEEFVDGREQLAQHYQQRLTHVDGARLVIAPPGQRHPYYKLPLVLPPMATRSAIGQRLKQEFGISTGSIYWPPCHMQPAFKQMCVGRHFPVADEILDRTLALPMHGALTHDEVDRVCDALLEILRGG